MSKQRNPNIDFGFHAVVPRLIRTGYDMLTPAQKWIYVCLKDLCGDDGTCYRALRTLAEETHVSTGLLSESIPTLHKVGLIHAEKKKRSSGGKEVWHITIADIWQANAKAHPTKRSQREQSPSDERSQNEQTISTDDTDVQNVNQNVHKMNDDSRERSHSEQECSFCETEVITLSNNNIEVITERDNTRITAIADDATPSPSFAGEDDGTHNRHNASRTVSSNDDNVIGNPPNPLEDPHRVVPAQQQTATPTEKPQLNRLTNPPEPPTQENVSTDESPRRIASETAEHTPSLPVVNAATDEVIHVDARNTTNSYSPSSEPKSEVEAETPEQNAGKGSGKGKGNGRSGNKKPSPTQEQIRKVFDTINEVFRKLHPETPDFKVVESEKATKAVKSLIDAKASPALVKLVMFDMWNEVDARGDHWWRKRGRMTVPAICEQYTSRAPGLASKLPNHAATKNEVVKDSLAENTSPKPPVVVSSSPLGAYSSRPELQPWKDDGAVSDDALNRPSWAAIKKQRKQAAGGR